MTKQTQPWSNKSLYEQARTTIAHLIQRIPQEDIQAVLDDVLTPGEMIEIAERLHLLEMLKAGKTQRYIAELLGISVTTVNRGNRVLQYGTGVIQKYL